MLIIYFKLQFSKQSRTASTKRTIEKLKRTIQQLTKDPKNARSKELELTLRNLILTDFIQKEASEDFEDFLYRLDGIDKYEEIDADGFVMVDGFVMDQTIIKAEYDSLDKMETQAVKELIKKVYTAFLDGLRSGRIKLDSRYEFHLFRSIQVETEKLLIELQ
jgi:hypothetical protein